MPRSAIRPLLGLLLMLSLVGAEVAQAAPERVRVVVGVEQGQARAAERLVRRLGGDVGRRLPIVDGFTARVPASSIARLRRSGSVRTVARDVALTLSTATPVEDEAATSGSTGSGSSTDSSDSIGSADSTGSASSTDSSDSTDSTAMADEPPANPIDPPPAELPTDEPADEVAGEVIGDASEDAAAGSSLVADPVASGEDTVGALQDAVADPLVPVEPVADDGPTRARAAMDLIRASAGAQGGLTGAGVDVALIDSGVLGIAALDGPGKLVRGPDFSIDAYDADLRGLDAFGHGSHMAGVIAGNDAETGYRGVAPGARLVSVKVAGADGITSLVRVLMAFDWVRRNRTSDGLNIRV